MDIRTLTDDELDQMRVDVLQEQERRQRLAQLPAQAAELAAAFETAGGNRSELIAAIQGDEQA